MNIIPVVFCFDKSWAKHTIVSINSLILNSSSPLKIYLLYPESDSVYIEDFFNNFSFNKQLIPVDTSIFYGWRFDHLSCACFLKLVIPDYVFEKKVIYLDSDTLTIGDISSLYETDLGSNFIGAVGSKQISTPIFEIKTNNNFVVRAEVENENLAAHFMKQIYPNEKILDIKQSKKIPYQNNDVYINSGVMLMNLELFRSNNSFNSFFEIYNTYKDCIFAHEQCVINKYAELKKTLVDSKWNYKLTGNASLDQFNTALKTARIIHFVSPNASCCKPWSDSAPSYIRDFWNSYELGVYYGNV